MAVHDDCPGLKAEILVDGKPLEEYAYEEENELPKTTTRYVECRSDSEFQIRTNFKPPFAPMDIALLTWLDGTSVSRRILRKHNLLTQPCIQSDMLWKKDGAWRASRYLFSSLNVGM
jgi:hypothetical protein